MKPIAPKDMIRLKSELIPEKVIEVWNDVIVSNWDGFKAHFKQDEVVEALLYRGVAATRSEIFENSWLDVEEIYREKGWKVTYDKPGYNETYSAFFVFKEK